MTTEVDLQSTPRREKAPVNNLDLARRLPPHSLEAEQGTIGCCLLDPKGDALGKCIDAISEEAFYDIRHRSIYETLVALWGERVPVDLVTVINHLRGRGQLDAVGGYAYLGTLQDTTPSSSNIDYYIDILREQWTLRKMLKAGQDMVAAAHNCRPNEAQKHLEEAEKAVLSISTGLTSQKLPSIRELARSAIDWIQDWFQRKTEVIGIPTGFVDYDKMTGGLHQGDMIVLAARPSMGKTALAMNIALHAAHVRGVDTGVFTLEMAARSLIVRLTCSEANVSSSAAMAGNLTEGDFKRLTAASAKIAKSKLHIDGTSDLTINQIRSRARKMYREKNCRLFIIDYLQLIGSSGTKKHSNREAEVAEISKGVKALAKELSVPVIILCQLNRDIEKGPKRRPKLSDLRESGSIEQDADVVGMLYNVDDPEDDDGPVKDPIQVNLSITKQRNGPIGEVFLTFHKKFTRFESASKINP